MKATCIGGMIVLAFCSFAAQAQDVNPNASMSVVGEDTFRVEPEATIGQPFSVRVVDAQGAPLRGIVVDFFVNSCTPLPLQPDSCPPEELYGHFDVTTDALSTPRPTKTAWPPHPRSLPARWSACMTWRPMCPPSRTRRTQ